MTIKLFVDKQIYRNRDKLLGTALKSPYLYTINGQENWVTDVLIDAQQEILTHVPILEVNRQVKNTVTLGTSVELHRNNLGFFYISGASYYKKGPVNFNNYKPENDFLGFTQGWKLGNIGYESGSGNVIPVLPEKEINYNIYSEVIPFGDLNFGITAFGAERIVKVINES